MLFLALKKKRCWKKKIYRHIRSRLQSSCLLGSATTEGNGSGVCQLLAWVSVGGHKGFEGSISSWTETLEDNMIVHDLKVLLLHFCDELKSSLMSSFVTTSRCLFKSGSTSRGRRQNLTLWTGECQNGIVEGSVDVKAVRSVAQVRGALQVCWHTGHIEFWLVTLSLLSTAAWLSYVVESVAERRFGLCRFGIGKNILQRRQSGVGTVITDPTGLSETIQDGCNVGWLITWASSAS